MAVVLAVLLFSVSFWFGFRRMRRELSWRVQDVL